jgi:hypothetical protein
VRSSLRRLPAFEKKLNAKIVEWKPRLAKDEGYEGRGPPRLLRLLGPSVRNGRVVADLEATPGLEPSSDARRTRARRHPRGKALRDRRAVLQVRGLVDSVATSTSLKVIALPMGSTGRDKDATWIDWMDHVITSLAEAVPPPKAS